LLTASYTFVNPSLASLRITYPGTGTDFVKVENVPHRFGLLTQPSILAGHAHPNQSAPVKRASCSESTSWCTDPPRPGRSDHQDSGGRTRLDTKERFLHTARTDLRRCHVMLDPLGLTLENYDELGRWRDLDGGKPVDASGGFTLVASLAA